MACIVLADMNPPTTNPVTSQNDLTTDAYQATGDDTKQEMEATCLSLHIYYQGNTQRRADCSEKTLKFPPGEYVAEELCITAAKACGESHTHV